MAASRFLRVLLVLVSAFLTVPASEANGEALHFRLVHRSQLEDALGDGQVDAFRRLEDITRRDQLRQEHITETLRSPRRKAFERSFEAPIQSGAYSGAGEYFVKLKIGSPARDYLLVADTGSDLTWTKCQEGGRIASRTGRRRATEACVPSSSFDPYQCSTDSCQSLPFSTTVCPTPTSACLYDYRYADGSFTKGTYGNDTVLVTAPDGSVTPIRDVLVGRSSDSLGVIFDKTDGVLGLGFSPISFAITTAQLYGGKFSYCLVDHLNHLDSNYLVFGNNSRTSKLNIRYANLVLDSMIQPYYGIEVDGISMEGKMLPIPPAVWQFVFKNDSIGGGVIIDSGMTLTSLVKPAYDIVMSAFRSYFEGFPTFAQPPFELCFNVTQLSPEQAKRVGPNMAWHFSGGAKFTPHIGSYVTVVAPNLKCISIVPSGWPGMSIIGNIHQQKYLWEFDLANGRKSPRRRASEGSFQAPISSGAYAGVGEYFVKLNVGSPAKEYLLVADTGSDLTWIECQTGCAPSSSFVPYKCSSDACKSLPFSLTTCPSPASPCLYDYLYADGSFSKGTYGNETVTFTSPDGSVSTIRDVLVGRSSEFQGTCFNEADGVLALGFSAISFAIAAAQIYGGKFSYCLVDHFNINETNYLVVGDNPRVSNRSDLQFAPLVFDQRIQPFYGLQVDGISFDGKMLPIAPPVWSFHFSNDSITGGVIIDSGVTLTTLVQPVYDVVLANFRSYFQDFPTFAQPPFDLCFHESQLCQEQRKKARPQLGWHFAGGAKFMPHIDSYVTAVAADMKCVTIVPAAWPGISIIGNIHQQKYLWEFNLETVSVGFAPSQ